MATETKILRVQSPVSDSPPTSFAKEHRTEEQHSIRIPESKRLTNSRYDFFILHNASDVSWTAKLAERIGGERFGNRNLQLSLGDWNAPRGADIWVEMRNNIRAHRVLGIVVSRARLQEDYQAIQRAIEFLKELSPAEGRIVAILKENVSLPPILRMREWFDFRNEEYFEESLSDLSSFLRDDFALDVETSLPSADSRLDSVKHPASPKCSSFGVGPARERIISNLFPVAEVPRFVFSAETRFTSETELTEACCAAGPSPFLLKGSRLYTIEPLSKDSVFASALTKGTVAKQEDFTQCLSRHDRAKWAIELLNNFFRHHAWKRGLRYDRTTDQYYFPRTKPKSVWWEISQQTISREVTAPHMGWIELENELKAEVQYGWRHHTIRAEFVQVMASLCLRLEPGWLLTKLDGETPAPTQLVAPLFSGYPQQQRNGQVLRSLRFWSTVLAKGHLEIRMNTGQAPVRIKLTPLSGFTPVGIASDRTDYDQLMVAEMEDDLMMPALGPLEQESVISDEEIISFKTLRCSRSRQSQACVKHSTA
jgi:hypothetical protein